MKIHLYRQNEITLKKVGTGVNSTKNMLDEKALYKISYTNNATMPLDENYIDVPLTADNKTVNYVIIEDEAQQLAFFVNDYKVISANVLRLFITVDTVSTFFSPAEVGFENGYFKRSNYPGLYNLPSVRTLSFEEVNAPMTFSHSSTSQSIVFDGEKQQEILSVWEVTEGPRTGQTVHVLIVPSSTGKPLDELIFYLALIDRAQFLDEEQETTHTIKLKASYVLPFEITPTIEESTSGIFLFPKGEATGISGVFYEFGRIYPSTNNVKRLSGNLTVTPERNYRIGTKTHYAEYSQPTKTGTVPYSYVATSDLISFHLYVELFGDLHEITSGVELPLVDAVQLKENNERKTESVIANSLSIIGQAGTAVGAFATGNVLAGVLGVGNLASNINQLIGYRKQRITGGLLTEGNAGLLNLRFGWLLGEQVGVYDTSVISTLKLQKGYKMLEPYSVQYLKSNYYYEIICDGLNQYNEIPLKFVPDFLSRLSNGVYVL